MKNPTWTADELHNVISRAKNAVNKNKAFEQLANETGRSFFSIQNKFYDYQEHFKTEIPKEERERGVRNLYNRGKNFDEIAKQYGMPSSAVKLILKDLITITKKSKAKPSERKVEQKVKPLYESKEERDDKIRELSESGKSHRTIAKEVGLGKSMVGDVLRGYEYRKDEPTPQPKSKKVNKQNIARFELNFLWGLLRITKQQ